MSQAFWGRKDIIGHIRRRVADHKEGYRQNLALLGSQHVGKSALLLKFLADLDDQAIAPVYLDLESRDLHYFFSRTARSLLYHLLKARGLPLSEELTDLLERARGHVPLTAQKIEVISALLKNSQFNEAYDQVLNLPELFSSEAQMHCVLLYDEFHAIEHFGVANPFQRLACCVTTQKSCLYIMTSSFEEQARKILAERLTLLFGNFEIVHVLPFDLKASQEFIEARLGSLKMGLQLRNFLADFTAGRPLYLDILIRELNNLGAIYKQQEIYAPLIAQALENLISNRWGALSRHFELVMNRLCVGKQNRLIMLLLIHLSEGKHKVRELVDCLGAGQHQVVTRLNWLIDQDIIEKNGNFFHIKDKLMRYWIKFVFIKRHKAIEIEPGRQDRDFKDEVSRAISDFQQHCRKDLSSRMMELLHCFENEMFSLHGRTYKLPAFRDLASFKMPRKGGHSFDVIKAQTDEGLWLLVLRKDPVAEGDISDLREEAKKMGLKPRRCVIVSMTDLDDSVKLRALEEKIWIWNEPVLNSLMTLYDKPSIVL
jgi:hypothetical protein